MTDSSHGCGGLEAGRLGGHACCHCVFDAFQALCVAGTMEGGRQEDRRRFKRARTAELRACECRDVVAIGYNSRQKRDGNRDYQIVKARTVDISINSSCNILRCSVLAISCWMPINRSYLIITSHKGAPQQDAPD